MPDNEEDINLKESAKIVYYYVTWCPHCKKATPEWESVKKEFDDKEVNGTTIHFEDVNCEKNSDRADTDKIEAYPTIRLIKRMVKFQIMMLNRMQKR